MLYERIDEANRAEVAAFIERRWYTTTMVVRGRTVDMTTAEGFIRREGASILGLATFRVEGGELEILSLDSLRPNQGIGSGLIEAVVREAGARGCRKVTLVTTNDNTDAMRFYQKRGFDMARLYRNALDVSRKLKPEIPLIGENGIPLRHEIAFERLV